MPERVCDPFPRCQREKVNQGFQTAVPEFMNYHFDPFVVRVISNFPTWKAEYGNLPWVSLTFGKLFVSSNSPIEMMKIQGGGLGWKEEERDVGE